MKLIGAVLLAIGLGLGIYAATMKVGLEVPSKNLGFGITTPAVSIANPELTEKRKNYFIGSGILVALGILALGVGARKK